MWPLKKNLPARSKKRAQCVLRSVTKYFAFGEGQATRMPVAQKSLLLSNSGKSSRPRVRRSKRPRRFRLGLAHTNPPEKKRRLSSQYGHKVIFSLLESANTSGSGPSESGRAGSGWKKAMSIEGWKKAHHIQNRLRQWSAPK